jgi:hypothetical protein
MVNVWTKDPLILFRKDQIEFWPSKSQPLEKKVNAIARLIIILTIVGTIFTKSISIASTGVVALLSLMIIYYTKRTKRTKDKDKKEGMTPNMRLEEAINDGEHLSSSIQSNIKDSSLDEANRKRWYSETSREQKPLEPEIKVPTTSPTKKNPMMNVLMTDYRDNPKRPRAKPSFAPSVRENIDEKTKEQIEDDLNEKLFKDLGDEIQFDRSMQHFYTTANTQIPNDQKAFADFCFGNMSSCKDGEVDECFNNNKKIGQNFV